MRLFLLLAIAFPAQPATFTPSASRIEAGDFVEIAATGSALPGNPFLRFELQGTLQTPSGETLTVDGFCDSADGSIHRIRFYAARPGAYRYRLQFAGQRHEGAFTATESRRKGLLETDPAYPFHFQWTNTKEHYFWNGLTTYALLGWKDSAYIEQIVDRAARYQVNRLRVTLLGPRVEDASRWYEPVKPSDGFQFLFGPWLAANPSKVSDPGWDVARYDTAFFQKAERAIRHARERDVVISVIFFLDGADKGADPFGKAAMFGEDARRYYRYVNARLGAYSNVTWDVTNEWHLFRNAWWVEQMGSYLKSIDPYHHLVSTHGRGDFPWAVSQWPGFALYQIWDEAGGYEPMLERRKRQLATGHPFPQINEEYGYEDHYPARWGGNRRPPARSADNRRRLAWDITMAGCYQTTGEKANRNGDGQAPATPGGWINGGFDDSMHMLTGYQKMVAFFTSFEWWKLEPVAPAAGPARVLAAPGGERYVVYLRDGGTARLALAAGDYRVRRYGPASGTWQEAGRASGTWQAPETPAGEDAAFLLERDAPARAGDWQPLFDGNTLGQWKTTPFPRQSGVRVENGILTLPAGQPLTGVTWQGDFPKKDYELRFEAARLQGGDFFASVTLPAGGNYATWVLGGWGGDIVGISSIDGWDASDNETRTYVTFEPNRWYAFRIRVTASRIQAWIDDQRVVNVSIAGRTISLRPGDINLSAPLGFASYNTTGGIRRIEYRPVPSE